MAKKLYVGNLTYDTTEDNLVELFSEYGEVLSAQIIIDRDTNRSKGFGFVEMADGADEAANALNGQDFRGRNLTVNEARPREDRGGGGGGGGYGGGGGGGRGGYGGGGGGGRGGYVAEAVAAVAVAVADTAAVAAAADTEFTPAYGIQCQTALVPSRGYPRGRPLQVGLRHFELNAPEQPRATAARSVQLARWRPAIPRNAG